MCTSFFSPFISLYLFSGFVVVCPLIECKFSRRSIPLFVRLHLYAVICKWKKPHVSDSHVHVSSRSLWSSSSIHLSVPSARLKTQKIDQNAKHHVFQRTNTTQHSDNIHPHVLFGRILSVQHFEGNMPQTFLMVLLFYSNTTKILCCKYGCKAYLGLILFLFRQRMREFKWSWQITQCF